MATRLTIEEQHDSYKEQFSNIFEVGDEVKDKKDKYRYIVTKDEGSYLQCIDSNGEVYQHILKSGITKTGRTFPWFKEILVRFTYE